MGIFNKKKVENVISVEGYADDLYEISKNGEMKQTRLFYVIPENLEENQETMDLCITSTNPYHSQFLIIYWVRKLELQLTLLIKQNYL